MRSNRPARRTTSPSARRPNPAQVAKAKPDGYTLLLGGAAGLVVNPAANPNVTYDPVKDLDPVTLLALAGLAMTVHPAVPAKTLPELIAHVKANQGKMFYASSGVGTAVHLAGELFKQLIDAPGLGHVPYKGAAPLGGEDWRPPTCSPGRCR